jgi:hypothetical protein
MLARQLLYHLIHSSSSFCFSYFFLDKLSVPFAHCNPPSPTSQVAGNTDPYHRHFLNNSKKYQGEGYSSVIEGSSETLGLVPIPTHPHTKR